MNRPQRPLGIVHAQAEADRLVKAMAANNAGMMPDHAVEATGKNDYTPTHLPTKHYAGWDSVHYFDENMARLLVGGYFSKWALIKLVFLLLREIRVTRKHCQKPDLDAADAELEQWNEKNPPGVGV